MKLGTKFSRLGSKMPKSDCFKVFTFVSQSQSHIIGNNTASVFISDWKLKSYLRNFIFVPFEDKL